MSVAMQQVAKQLLDRPVQGDVTLGQWLQTQFPQLVEYVEVLCERDSRETRQQLARALDIPGLFQPLGSSAFEIAYQQAVAEMVGNTSHSDMQMEQFDSLERQRARFHAFRDMGIQMQDDILPRLHDLSHDAGCDYVRADDVIDMINACGRIATSIRDVVPKALQMDEPQQAYNQFAEDMKALLRCAYQNDMKRNSSPLGFVDKLQAKNRLDDYWRKH